MNLLSHLYSRKCDTLVFLLFFLTMPDVDLGVETHVVIRDVFFFLLTASHLLLVWFNYLNRISPSSVTVLYA